ncbi:major histocompatibility complex class I-related gene protein-like isoform X2 [Hemicordylus capensis]|uniref:major histocompatibility complex class I-related gene protein-like isoform X2 n=1 Tax=Hemicordylus capensis TaxID=884348 RepID=UPI0023024B48|nr:major histocompatibility complex class I-related gene protein-like isoform X2 [Hemicordylus capensis]
MEAGRRRRSDSPSLRFRMGLLPAWPALSLLLGAAAAFLPRVVSGLHTWQCLVGCELSKDGNQKGRSMQCGYDGKDFISLDKETFTWIAADAKAQVTKRKWESNLDIAMTWKGYLEKECIESLQRYRDTGKETLLRTESPMVKVTRKVGQDGLEALICRADGFYPKEIEATWRKDGEIWEHETFRGSVTPNSDGTYHTWLKISVDPKDKERYWCHVEHDGLSEPLDLAWEEPPASKHMSMVWWISVPIITVGLMLLKRHYLWKRRRLKKNEGFSYLQQSIREKEEKIHILNRNIREVSEERQRLERRIEEECRLHGVALISPPGTAKISAFSFSF